MVQLLRSRNGSSIIQQAGGFTLTEILVSLTILALGLSLLAGVLLRSARTAQAASSVSFQTATMASEVARLSALPFNLLAVGTVCDTVIGGQFARIRCSIITETNPKLKQVMVRVTATGQPPLPPDSVIFERSISGSGTPLNTQ